MNGMVYENVEYIMGASKNFRAGVWGQRKIDVFRDSYNNSKVILR